MVRRKGWGAFRKHGIIALCEVCGEDYERVRANQKYCPDCKIKVRRKQVYRAVNKHRDNNPYETQDQKKVAQETVSTPDPWTNLMLAVVQQADAEKDTEWLEENKEVYTRAILGRDLLDG